MRRLLFILLHVTLIGMCAIAGAILVLLTNPDANIDRDGWKLGGMGLGGGFVLGLILTRKLLRHGVGRE